jgi:hypothetical protein
LAKELKLDKDTLEHKLVFMPANRSTPFKIEIETNKTVLLFCNDVATFLMLDGYGTKVSRIACWIACLTIKGVLEGSKGCAVVVEQDSDLEQRRCLWVRNKDQNTRAPAYIWMLRC